MGDLLETIPIFLVVKMDKIGAVSFEEAKEVARSFAKETMRHFWPSDEVERLSDNYLEGKNFWIFFRNKGVPLPEEAWLQKQMAYVIGADGSQFLVHDFTDRPKELQECLDGLTKRFSNLGMQAYRDGA